jgi:hypothetical protein
LSRGYAAGALVVEVEAFTFRLVEEPDRTFTLVRETVAGAVQPIVDGVVELWFEPDGADGRVRRVTITVCVGSLDLRDTVPSSRTFRTTVTLRNVP